MAWGCRAILLLLLLTPLVMAQPAVPYTQWTLEELTLANGGKFEGLTLEDAPLGIKFMTIRRVPGRPTITLTSYFPRAEIGTLKKISDSERSLLKERLAELDPSGTGERKRMESVDLTEVPWLDKPKGARRYVTDRFVLVSAAPEEVTRRAAVRLEQIYAAFSRFLPPRVELGKPTTVLLAGDLDQYRTLLDANSGRLLNPAVFDPTSNRIICGTDLRRLGDELSRTRLHHLQQLATADKTEKDLRELYKHSKPDLERYLTLVNKERARISAAERENDRTFDQATRRVFAMLYHEAFHSYTMNYVFPARTPAEIQAGKGTGELPRWLNEGMAQLFENPLVEAGELRVELADPARVKKVREWLAAQQKGQTAEHSLIPLQDLLKAGKETFLAAHANQQEVSDRTYLTSWALAYYLTFERRVFGTKAFDQYLKTLNTGGNPIETFNTLTGQPLPQFEKDWIAYLGRINLDGTLREEPAKK